MEAKDGYKEFLEQKLYAEYFDNRLYLVEQYLDFVQRVLEDRNKEFDLYAYIKESLECFRHVMDLEKAYFLK